MIRASLLHRLATWMTGSMLCLIALSASAQEPLDDILARGYVAHWLVCGPFAPDAEGGILGAAQRGEAPLGTTDYLQPVGGAQGVRPRHLLAVAREGDDAIWQQAGTESARLDLAPFFPTADEGIAYAAFYVESLEVKYALLEIHSPLGARVWINGRPTKDVAAGALAERGVDRVVAGFAAGSNLVLLEVPGVRLDALAERLGESKQGLWSEQFASRTLLDGASGFAIALRMQPAEPLGQVYFVPALEALGTFSGSQNDPRQNMQLALINPSAAPAPPVQVQLRLPEGTDPVALTVPPLRPWEFLQTPVAVPVGKAEADSELAVEVVLGAEGASASFRSNVRVAARGTGGVVETVTGPFYAAPGDNQAAVTSARTASLTGQVALRVGIPDYGFNAGPVEHWQPFLAAQPALLGPLRTALVQERAAALPQYAQLDDRLVHGALLLQNLRYGIEGAATQLQELRPSPILMGAPALASQTAQWLTYAGFDGLLTDVPAAGPSGLFRAVSPDGTILPVRQVLDPPMPTSVDGLRSAAGDHRAAGAALNLPMDLMPLHNAVAPPEPFMETAATTLSRALPAVRLDGGGAFRFFQTLKPMLPGLEGALHLEARRWTEGAWGDLLARPDILEAHARATRRTLQASAFATMAGVIGADFPEPAIDAAWRQLLHVGGVGRMGAALDAENTVDTLASLRDAAEWSDTVLRRSLDYLALEADTLGQAPADTEGVQALMVFNPSSWTRDDVVRAEVRFAPAAGLTVLDDVGAAVPFYADRLQYNERRQLIGARVQFVAQAVPGIGYRAYYVSPKGALPQPSFTTDPQIQNDLWTVLIDPATGDIAQWIDKRTQQDHAAGGWNRVIGLRQDGAKMQGGRDLWTTGEKVASTGTPDIQTTTLPWVEQITVSTGFGSGRLVRELTLYRGLAQGYCTVRYEPRALPEHTLVGLHFGAEAGATATFGERFAAQVPTRSRADLAFQSQAGANLSGSSLQPAWDWIAAGAGDGIRIGADRWLPLRPTLIAHGPAFKGAAETLLLALAQRGVPTTLWSTAAPEPGVAVRQLVDPNDDLARGEGLRVVMGVVGEDAYLDALLKRLDPATQTYVAARLEAGVAVLVEDDAVPPGTPPVTVLLMTGATPEVVLRLAEDMARDWGQSGILTIAPSAVFIDALPAPATGGMAVLFSGARLASHERTPSLFLALDVVAPPGAGGLEAPVVGIMEMQYALLPYDQDWRAARIPAAAEAFNAPLLGAQTTLHSGRQPGAQRLLGLDSERFILTHVRPAGAGRAAFEQRVPHPNEGVVVQGYESTGGSWSGALGMFRPLRDASPSGLLGRPGAGMTVTGNEVGVTARSFGLAAWWLMPDTRFVHADPAALAGSTEPGGAIHAAWWEQRLGAAPAGNLPLALTLARDAVETTEAVLRVANLTTDARLSGAVSVTAGQGWTAGPNEVAYDLGPGELLETGIRLAPLGDGGTPLRLVAEATVEGQGYRAVLGDAPPVLVNVTRTLAQIKVQLTNDGIAPAVGLLDLVTAPAHWPELGGQPRYSAGPRRAPVQVEPGRTQDILFRLGDPDAPLAAVVKLAIEGSVTYHAVPGATPPGPRERQPEASPQR